MDRVAVFIDYENVFRVGRGLFTDASSAGDVRGIDPVKLAQIICSKRNSPSELVAIFIFRGRPVPTRQPRAAALNDAQAMEWLKDSRVVLTLRDLQYVQTDTGFSAREKGIDVALAVSLVEHAMSSNFDVQVLVSTDTDLLPAIELVFRKASPRVEIATWIGARPLWIKKNLNENPPRRLPYSHKLSGNDFGEVSA